MNAEPAAPVSAPDVSEHVFEFTGSGGEYFRIWIVNILLTILTLGIYSAWATVRTKRYLYGNTRVMGSGFEFHARPLTILKGRAVAVLVLATIVLLGTLAPGAQVLAMLALFPLVPFLIVRSRVFNAVNSSWRNVRFNFNRRYGQAYAVYMGWPLLIPFTLGFLAPYVSYQRNRFLVENSALGKHNFSFHCTVGGFYARLLGMFFAGVGLAVVLFSVMGIVIAGASVAGGGESADGGAVAAVVGASVMVLFYAALGVIGIITRVLILNYVWSGVGVRGARMSCTLGIWRTTWIMLSNILLIVITLGLFSPWAITRMARYRANCTRVSADEQTVNELTAAEQQDASAIGDEAIDIFGVEVGAV